MAGIASPIQIPRRHFAFADVPDVNKVKSLQNHGDFLMHGVVLQNRVFRPPARCFT
jgi:hypothetical protein